MLPPLAVDVDGTLSRPDRSIDARVFDALRTWAAEAPVVIATGKALPYPVALCQFVGIPERVIAENGGLAVVEGTIRHEGDREAADAVLDAYRDAGHDAGWDGPDLVNRWRETEVAVSRDQPLDPLRAAAADHGLEVVDTGFAYHVKSPDVSKGRALDAVAAELGVGASSFVAVGDSRNDVSLFERVARGYAVANADEAARATADVVTDADHADGFLEALDDVRTRYE